MSDKKLGILFFGRLDDEKGFALILDALKMFIQNHGHIPFSFYVFGKGKYAPDLMELASKHSSIHFFGRQALSTIQRYKENCQFCLMPSTFLETFGLTALNALSMGVPVIGFSKGGLKQFIPNKYDILKSPGKDEAEKIYNKISELLSQYQNGEIDIEKERTKAISISKKYNIDQRFQNIQPIIGKPKRILLVSDFKSKLGGIETYIHDVQEILISKGYEVQVYGSNIPAGKIGQIVKYLSMFASVFNFVDAIRLKKVVRKFKPKVVWYHSVLRELGRFPIQQLSAHNSQKIMMYHDLGYFHPYPSVVTQEDLVKTPLNYKNFIKSAKTKNPFKIIAVSFKYFLLLHLSKQLKKNIDLHLVPSDFLSKMLADSYQLDPKKIQTLPHFIQK